MQSAAQIRLRLQRIFVYVVRKERQRERDVALTCSDNAPLKQTVTVHRVVFLPLSHQMENFLTFVFILFCKDTYEESVTVSEVVPDLLPGAGEEFGLERWNDRVERLTFLFFEILDTKYLEGTGYPFVRAAMFPARVMSTLSRLLYISAILTVLRGLVSTVRAFLKNVRDFTLSTSARFSWRPVHTGYTGYDSSIHFPNSERNLAISSVFDTSSTAKSIFFPFAFASQSIFPTAPDMPDTPQFLTFGMSIPSSMSIAAV